MFANTMFKAVCYNPEECQIVTAGTDRKVRIATLVQRACVSLSGSHTHRHKMFIIDITESTVTNSLRRVECGPSEFPYLTFSDHVPNNPVK